jgi:peptide/nickel transport system permease protein
VRLAAALVGLLALTAIVGPALSPYHPDDHLDGVPQYAPPSASHPLGTDFFSRDVLTRVVHGARISLGIALLSVIASLTVGTAVGLVAGYAGGATDTMLMRLVDVALAIPRLFLLLMVAALWQGAGITVMTLILVLGLTSWFETSRLVRAQVLSLKHRDFIVAPLALGVSAPRVVLAHVLPNVIAPLLVAGTLGLGTMILAEAGLSYLGLGIPQPAATLGRMIAEGSVDALRRAPWVIFGPGLFLTLSVLGFALLSEGIREASDRRGVSR